MFGRGCSGVEGYEGPSVVVAAVSPTSPAGRWSEAAGAIGVYVDSRWQTGGATQPKALTLQALH